jgi:hypothetical protein
LLDGEAIRMHLEKWSHRFAGVIADSILHNHHMAPDLRQDLEQKRRVAFRVETPCVRFVEKPP